MSYLPPLTGESAGIVGTVSFDELDQVLRCNAVASPQTDGIQLTLADVAVYGQGMNLQNFGYLFRGE
jgi:hypothetical protein